MIRRLLFILSVALGLFSLVESAAAIVRINGNQMVDGVGEFGSRQKVGAQSAATSAPAPVRLIYSTGQAVLARGELSDSAFTAGGNVAVVIGIGLGYDIAQVVYQVFCPIELAGDVNEDGQLDNSDIVQLVRFTFNGGATPSPCVAAGDVNCSGQITGADCTYLIRHVFLGGPPPCDICNLIPDVWTCP